MLMLNQKQAVPILFITVQNVFYKMSLLVRVRRTCFSPFMKDFHSQQQREQMTNREENEQEQNAQWWFSISDDPSFPNAWENNRNLWLWSFSTHSFIHIIAARSQWGYCFMHQINNRASKSFCGAYIIHCIYYFVCIWFLMILNCF